MGKSYKKNNCSERNKSNDFKRRKIQIKEERVHEDFADYKIHGFKKKAANI